MLQRIKQFKDEINSTTSRTEKISLASNFEDIVPILNMVYDDDITFGLKSSQLSKYREEMGGVDFDNLTDLLIALDSREITGNHAIGSVTLFKNKNQEYSEIIDNILDKDLRCRFGKKDYLKAFPGAISNWEIALGEKYLPKYDSEFVGGDYYVSRKLDGTRLIAIKTGNEIVFKSKTGKVISTLRNYVQPIIDAVGDINCVLDMELLYEKGNTDDFKTVMTQLNKKNHDIDNLTCIIFDMLTHDEFFSTTSKRLLSERYSVMSHCILPNDKVKILAQHKYTAEQFESMVEQCREQDWEGLIIRKNDIYKGKRSKDIIKWKEFFDAEYTVIGIESGVKQMVVNGQNVDVECMARVNIVHKGNIVGVGSGWSDGERVAFHKDPSLIIGKVITVRYKQETTDEQGKLSLQFPVVKIIHGEKRVF